MQFSSLTNQNPWLITLSGFVLALTLALTLALFGWFSPGLTLCAAVFLFGGIGLSLVVLYQKHDRLRLILIGVLTLGAIFIAIRTEPTVFTGRDQGSIALASLELAAQHELAFRTPVSDAFFAVYGPGRALNFPGFSYTDTGALITQFPLGYIAYLGIFTSWFGPTGLLIANALLFILSGWTFFELLTLFVSRRNALLGTILFATSFIIVWLTQITLTENLALFLFLSLVVALVYFHQDNDAHFLPALLVTGFLLALTRIEGFVIAPLALAYILYRPTLRNHLLRLPKKWTVPTLLFLSFLFLRDFFMNLPFYTTLGKAALKYWHTLSAGTSAGTEPNLGPILISYGLFPLFVLGIAALIFEVMQRRTRLIIPILLAAPTLIYLLNGHISDDHPWLLRRYAFTLFPLFLLATVVLWDSLETKLGDGQKKLFAAVCFSFLFIFQIPPSFQALKTVEYQTLYEQTLSLGQQFGDRDLILIDRGSTGDPFAMITGPLATLDGKNAVYFFNPEDYSRIDRHAFEHTYLLTTAESLSRYAEVFDTRLIPRDVISFSSPTLIVPSAFAWPETSIVKSDALLFEVTP